jgi:uncharacterized protein
MAETVNVSSSPGSNYSWSSGTFTWGSATAGKNWSTAYPAVAPQRRISFNAMVNRANASRAAIQRFFIELTGDPSVPIGEGSFVDAYDEGGIAHSLRPDELHAYRKLAFHEIRTGQAANVQAVSSKTASFVNSIRSRRPASSLGQKCGMDKTDSIAVDLRGNVLTCQNVSAASTAPNGLPHRIGHVSDLGAVKLNTARHWSKREDCPSCPMLQICQGSCMFLEGPLWDRSCDNAFSDAVPIFAAGIEFLTGLVPFHIEGDLREDRKDNPRYKACFACTSAPAFAKALAQAGYATDPAYADKVIGLIKQHNLLALDGGDT